MPLREELLQFLACPRCHGDLTYDEKEDVLICPRCKLEFPIEDGIPVLLLDEAKEAG